MHLTFLQPHMSEEEYECPHPAVDLLVTRKPNRSVSGSKPCPDSASEPALSSSLRFFRAGLNILLTKEMKVFNSQRVLGISQMQKLHPKAETQRPLSRTLDTVVRSSRCEAYVVYAHIISSNYSCISLINKLQDYFHPNHTKRDERDIVTLRALNVITFYVSVMFDLSVAVEAPSKFL